MIKLCIYTCNLGCERVKGGDDGCGWVRMGALGCSGHGAHKNKPGGGDLGSPGSEFGPYGRGNFPGHHVLGCLAKNGVDGYRWMTRGLYGCIWTQRRGGRKKQGEKSPKWARCGCFVKYVHAKKSKEGGNDGYRARGGAFKGIWV